MAKSVKQYRTKGTIPSTDVARKVQVRCETRDSFGRGKRHGDIDER